MKQGMNTSRRADLPRDLKNNTLLEIDVEEATKMGMSEEEYAYNMQKAEEHLDATKENPQAAYYRLMKEKRLDKAHFMKRIAEGRDGFMKEGGDNFSI